MQRDTLKDSLYGALAELVKNPKIFYNSSIGKDYSKFTEEGRAQIIEWLEVQAKEVAEAEEKNLDARAKKMVLDELNR
jgi:hypothetical protein